MDIKRVTAMFEIGVGKLLVSFNMIMTCEISNIVDNRGYERCHHSGSE